MVSKPVWGFWKASWRSDICSEILRGEENQANEEGKEHSSRSHSRGMACAKALRHKRTQHSSPCGEWPYSRSGAVERQGRKEGRGVDCSTKIVRLRKTKIEQTRDTAICGITLPFWPNEFSEHANKEESQEAHKGKDKQKPKSTVKLQPTMLFLHVTLDPIHIPYHLLSPPYLHCPSTLSLTHALPFSLPSPGSLRAPSHFAMGMYSQVCLYFHLCLVGLSISLYVLLLTYTLAHMMLLYVLTCLHVFCICENVC